MTTTGTIVNDDRPTWHRKKKQLNRRAILDAALAAFTDTSYSAVTVDDIVGRAKVSRATFYKHFASKVAITRALSDERVSPMVAEAYDRLADLREPTPTQLAEWVDAFLGIIEQNQVIVATLAEVWAVEPEYYAATDLKHEEHIRALGRGIPAFRLAAAASTKNEAVRIRAHLLLRSLENFCTAIVIRGWPIDRHTGIRVMAREFQRFIEDFP